MEYRPSPTRQCGRGRSPTDRKRRQVSAGALGVSDVGKIGQPSYTDSNWVGLDGDFWTVSHALYGISGTLTVAHVPEIDPATGGSALSLIAGVLAVIEQRRRRAALVA